VNAVEDLQIAGGRSGSHNQNRKVGHPTVNQGWDGVHLDRGSRSSRVVRVSTREGTEVDTIGP
jgi:hypothetical protein